VYGGVKGWTTGDYRVVDSLADLDGLRRVMSGDFSGHIGVGTISYDLASVGGDSVLTALTLLPGLGGARASLAALSGLGASAVAMAGVEVSPIPPEYKGALRFVAGLGAGIGAGVGTDWLLRRSPSLLVSETRKLSGAARLAQVEGEIAAAQAAGKAVAAELLEQQAALAAEKAALSTRVGALRDLGKDTLPAAELAYDTALAKVLDLEKRAATRGLAPSERARLLKSQEMKQARQALRDAEDNLARLYQGIDKAAGAQKIGLQTVEGASLSPSSGRSVGPPYGEENLRAVTAEINASTDAVVIFADSTNPIARQKALDILAEAERRYGVATNAVTAYDAKRGFTIIVFRNTKVTPAEVLEELRHLEWARAGNWNKDVPGVFSAFELRELDAASYFRTLLQEGQITQAEYDETIRNLARHLSQPGKPVTEE
jgi:hypothetical protein